jgi:intracellular septation protein
MKALNDYFSVVCFFIAWLITHSIYTATSVGIAAICLQVLVLLLLRKKITGMQWSTLAVWVVFGGMTLIFHNPIFIQWKPTIFYWLMGLVLIVNRYTSKSPILQRTMGDKIEMPAKIWNVMSVQWGIFLIIMGVINLFVAYHFSMRTWIYFKLFGCLGITMVFAIMQSIFLSKHMTAKQ